jgi:hypothetical protein
MTDALEAVLEAFVAACLDVFGRERVEAIVLHGSVAKGGAIPGYSDTDFMVFLSPDCFTADHQLPDETVFAIQERIAALPWRDIGASYPQAYFYDARRMPEWWTGPAPGAYRVLYGSIPAGIEATEEKLRQSAARYLEEMPRNLATDLRNFADSDDSSLPRRVRLIGTSVTPAIFALLTRYAGDALELWRLPKHEALARLETRFPDADGTALARQYYENVARLYGSEFDPALGRETFRIAVRFLRWVESVAKAPDSER